MPFSLVERCAVRPPPETSTIGLSSMLDALPSSLRTKMRMLFGEELATKLATNAQTLASGEHKASSLQSPQAISAIGSLSDLSGVPTLATTHLLFNLHEACRRHSMPCNLASHSSAASSRCSSATPPEAWC